MNNFDTTARAWQDRLRVSVGLAGELARTNPGLMRRIHDAKAALGRASEPQPAAPPPAKTASAAPPRREARRQPPLPGM